MNPNWYKKDRYIGIVSKMLEFPAKGIFSSNQFRATGNFYDDNLRKLGGKTRLITTDGRESHIFISDRLAYLPVRFPTYEEMDSCPKVPLTLYGEWKPLYLDNEGQWNDSNNNAIFGSNVSATSYTWSDNYLKSILSVS